MKNEKHSNEQLPNELSAVFSELQVSKYLRQVGIRKSFGFSCAYLFQLVSYLQSSTFINFTVAGSLNGKAIYALPGSTNAVKLAMSKLILPTCQHFVEELNRQ